jgi:hypothetical protein
LLKPLSIAETTFGVSPKSVWMSEQIFFGGKVILTPSHASGKIRLFPGG